MSKNLYSQSGLVAAYESWARSDYSQTISFPSSAIELKADWVPVGNLITWLGNNGVTLTPAQVSKDYYVVEVDHAPYALVSLHMSAKVLPNWLWSDFEHQLNPGRCDTMGCYDQFGVVPKSATELPAASANSQYGDCTKSKELLALFAGSGIGTSSVWNNYCLKGTQIDYVAPKGQPVLLGNSVIERLLAGVPISTSSCISCHTNAAFDSSGIPNPAVSESPIGKVTVSSGFMPYDFVWGVINVP